MFIAVATIAVGTGRFVLLPFASGLAHRWLRVAVGHVVRQIRWLLERVSAPGCRVGLCAMRRRMGCFGILILPERPQRRVLTAVDANGKDGCLERRWNLEMAEKS